MPTVTEREKSVLDLILTNMFVVSSTIFNGLQLSEFDLGQLAMSDMHDFVNSMIRRLGLYTPMFTLTVIITT